MNNFVNENKDNLLKFISDYFTTTRIESKKFWNKPLSPEIKSDSSPVTALDKMLEEIFRERAKILYPSFGIIGEEFGVENSNAEYKWVVDPIDGTQSLVERIPTFGTLVALLKNNVPIFGAIDHPLMDISFVGGEGIGVFGKDGKKFDNFIVEENAQDEDYLQHLRSVVIGLPGPHAFYKSNSEGLLKKVICRLPYARIYYDCFSHSMAVEGGIKAVLEYGHRIWDSASVMALISARGGQVLNLYDPWDGNPQNKVFCIAGQSSTAFCLHRLMQDVSSGRLGDL